MSEEYLFISDCHLDASRPQVIHELVEFINGRADSASHLFIQGDLFEVWLGDDDPADGLQAVIDSLTRRARQAQVYFLAGNRDFLLGAEFAANTGIELIREPHFLQLAEHRVALIHGDTLCTDDEDYQAFRSLVRDAAWQADFLTKPLVERQTIAARLRDQSADAMAGKSVEIMDVNADAVDDFFRRHRVDTVIHGHTHRPAVHRYPGGLTRYVLGDWNPRASYLCWRPGSGFELADPRV